MHFAPAIRPQLLDAIGQIDDGKRGIASIWRELGHIARARDFLQPSYESVRRIVHAQREAARLQYSRAKRAVILTSEFLWNTRDRKGIVLDAVDGNDVERRIEMYRKRPKPREDA